MEEVVFIAGLVGLAVAVGIVRLCMRRWRSYRELIEPELEKRGLEYVSSAAPRLFDTGPFPKFKVKMGGVRTETPFGRGEYTVYRVVKYRDGSGRMKESWAKLEFAAFRFKSIKWQPGI